jgi:hypothetical protein
LGGIEMRELWNEVVEKDFFEKSLEFATPEQLFYITDKEKYVAYWPKGYKGKKSTLQSRNSLIGNFTEKWVTDLIGRVVQIKDLHAVQGAICNELGLTKSSPADVIISKTNRIEQKPEDILAIFEVKMSIVWNWEYKEENSKIVLSCIGNYKTHQGNPGLLRSDSMLKAIGKSANIRASSLKSSRIPIIIIGNTPITNNYYKKVDHLKNIGFIQGFWSINPNPINSADNIKSTKNKGFYRFDNEKELETHLWDLILEERNFFSSMKNKEELGKIIEIANKKANYKEKAEEFLRLIGG